MKSFDGDESDSNTGRWRKEEHQAFVEAIKLYGKNWKAVANHIGTRNSTQVRSHAQKYFLRETTRLAVKQQAKEFYSKSSGSSYCKSSNKIDAATQYGEGITFPTILVLEMLKIFS